MARESPDPEFILRGSDAPVTSLCYVLQQPGPKLQLLSGTQNGSVNSWNLPLRRIEHSLNAHPGESVLRLQQCDISSNIVSHGRGGSVSTWKCQDSSWKKLDAFPAASLGFCGACVVKLEDKPLISIPSSTQSAVDVVSMETKGTSFSLAAQDNHGMCMDMKFTEIDSKPYLLIAYEDGLMALWDLKTQAMVSELQAHSDSVMCFDYSNALNRGVSGSVDEKLCVWSISPDTTLTRVKDFNITNPGVNCMKFRPDSKIVATGGWDGHVRIFSGKKQTPLAVLAYHKASILSVAFAADNTLAVGSKDATISIWNVYR